MTDQTTDALIRDLLAIAERFATTPDHQGAYHLDNRENLNQTGVCCQRRKWKPSAEVVKSGTGFRPAHQTLTGECAPSCVAFRATLTAARAHVAATQQHQLDLLIGGPA
jgi:hypothetical protein